MKEPFAPNELKIAVIGGGTGSFTLLSSLKEHTSRIAALVNMADDGGSTGQLRDELGVLPPGDVRQCLVALSRTPEIRDLFNYRFDDGALKGHAFGNLFLTALEKMRGNFADAVELASSILNIVGTVEPITLTNVRLAMENGDGSVTHGEFRISESNFQGTRPKMWLEPNAEANPVALRAIEKADIVVIAPGNLYGSLAPALIVPGVGEALRRSKALKVYICNLVTKPGQTDDFMVHDFAAEVERLAGTEFLDAVLYNTEVPNKQLLEKYAKEGELSVQVDEAALKAARYRAYGTNLLSRTIWQNANASDPLAASRTLIRHDSDAVALGLMELYEHLRPQ